MKIVRVTLFNLDIRHYAGTGKDLILSVDITMCRYPDITTTGQLINESLTSRTCCMGSDYLDIDTGRQECYQKIFGCHSRFTVDKDDKRDCYLHSVGIVLYPERFFSVPGITDSIRNKFVRWQIVIHGDRSSPGSVERNILT